MATGRILDFRPPEWLRGPASFANGELTLDLGRADRYVPYGEPALPFDLAAVAGPADALGFIRRYGLLNHAPDAPEHRESWEMWRDETQRLRQLLALYRDVQRATIGGDPTAVYGAAFASIPGDIAADATPDQRIRIAQAFIAATINARMSGSPTLILPSGTPGLFLHAVQTTDLLNTAYNQLARSFTERVPVQDCGECGRVFRVRDQRQRFCTPQCAGRARYRRWRNKPIITGDIRDSPRHQAEATKRPQS